MSKIDPVHLSSRIDRKSTILLQAARQNTESVGEKAWHGVEDPGMDAIRGSFGPVGSIIRARSARRLSQSSLGPNSRSRSWVTEGTSAQPPDLLFGMKRHQLWDPPVPGDPPSSPSVKSPSLSPSLNANETARPTTIKFDDQALVHSYHPAGTGDGPAIHEHRSVAGVHDGMPYSPAPIKEDSGTSQEEGGSGSGSTIRPQILSIPSFISDDKTVHSAPPTMSPRYPQAVRVDARDLFNKSSTSALLGQSDEEGGDGRGRNTRRYPKGAGEDDREESVSLWHRQYPDDRRDDTPTEAGGGIRLVQTSSRTRF